MSALAVVAVWLSVRDGVNAAEGTRPFEWLPIIESGINDVVFAGIAVYFLSSLLGRLQRRRTLAQLHRLRSLGKAAALHAEETDDSVVLDTISEIETLTSGISQGIWQKITLLRTGG